MAIIEDKPSHIYRVIRADGRYEDVSAGDAKVDKSGTLIFYEVIFYRNPYDEKRWMPSPLMPPPPRYTPFRWFAAGTWKEAIRLSDSAEVK